MSKSSRSAVASREQAERLLSPQQRHQSTYEQEVAILEERRRAQDEKTARLRALRLAKEAAEAKRPSGSEEQSTPHPVKPRKRSPASASKPRKRSPASASKLRKRSPAPASKLRKRSPAPASRR